MRGGAVRCAALSASFRRRSAAALAMRAQCTPAAETEVLREDHGVVQLITLNRPKALNALNWSMVRTMRPWYTQWMEDWDGGKQRAVVMKGAGEKAFCAGGDVVSIAKDKPPEGTGELRREFFRDEYRLNYAIKTLPFPHVAILDGIVMGGGVGLSVHGSHRIVTENSMFAMPETGIGLFPDVGGSVFLPRLPLAGLGMYLALTGHRLKGGDLLHAAIGTHYVPRSRLPNLEKALLCAGSASAVGGIIEEHAEPREALPPFSLEPHLDRIAQIFTGASIDDIISDLRSDQTEWTKATLDILMRMSPTSLRVTHEQILRGARQSAHDNFAMEARIVWHMMHHGSDFDEGVRALLVDKCKSPNWKPPTLEEVTPEMVAVYFQSLEDKEWKAD
eukprot:TRINITY_DN50359_c0_g1_i1.p1 TRINITY_DN50359_c0_g1~~TRINITY_DN50359_c0_g1_i1.p1  ORF type:complete len:390 (+),score=121.36 TRINITY_DN50359_c0_g1_i1:78-1247(+)